MGLLLRYGSQHLPGPPQPNTQHLREVVESPRWGSLDTLHREQEKSQRTQAHGI